MKTAIITGGSKGIGFQIANELTEKGFLVYSLSRSAPLSEKILHIPCDITKEEQLENAFNIIKSKHNHIDIFISNAGYGVSGATEFVKYASLKAMFDVNYFSAINAVSKCVPIMREKGGRIIFISSVASIFPIQFQSGYCATKCAITSTSSALKAELAPFKIKVGTILFGDINSDFTLNRKKEHDGKEFYYDRIENSVSIMEKDENNGMSSEKASKLAIKYILGKMNTPQHIVGTKYKFLCFLNRIFPSRFVHFLLSKMYG